MSSQRIFLTGATGYLGSRLIPVLQNAGHEVVALARAQSIHKLPKGCHAVTGNALDRHSYERFVSGVDAFVHLIGVPHPSPAKATEFTEIDLKSAEEAIVAASAAQVRHFIYVSVAHPAPAMKAYIAVRERCERMIRDAGLNATILRPWYVLGPGHRWPYALVPFYKLAEHLPVTRAGATRLGLVTINEMIQTLAKSIENRPSGVRVLEVPQIREAAKNRSGLDTLAGVVA